MNFYKYTAKKEDYEREEATLPAEAPRWRDVVYRVLDQAGVSASDLEDQKIARVVEPEIRARWLAILAHFGGEPVTGPAFVTREAAVLAGKWVPKKRESRPATAIELDKWLIQVLDSMNLADFAALGGARGAAELFNRANPGKSVTRQRIAKSVEWKRAKKSFASQAAANARILRRDSEPPST